MPHPIVTIAAALLAARSQAAQSGIQSAMTPKGGQAAQIAEIGTVLFIGGGMIFLGVMLLLYIALFGPARMRNYIGRRTLMIGGGIVFPIAVLSMLLVYTFMAAAGMVRADEAPAARIEITGELWWWRVRYLDPQGKVIVETANDVRIPAGQSVEFLVRSDNVIHSFWVPNLAGKMDTIPGHVNRLRIQADQPGIFRGQCAEYCGVQHANMALHVIALPPRDYASWLAAQTQPAREPVEASLQAGKQYFMHACAQCHTIRGTQAAGKLGPDLTHVGSRYSIAAGTLPNNVGAFAGWIAGSQHIKPGNQMPSFNDLSGEGLRYVAQYMDSLK
ncbi:cytochrome c oxidase subunit II [Noviherbaspirillum sp. Root189]|uniref:cytochrome c oxidase subunit II n=1 Tax=Noviherbaspirillum sp. Root189 TaxID=1736487 RepID=UPI0009EA2FF9|nr:c-type cytochrome [Noviherbaspirillum sp. Root189]